MSIDEAHAAIAELAKSLMIEIELDEEGNFLMEYDRRLPVFIKTVDDVLVLGAIIADGVSDDQLPLLAALMSYQWLTLRTRGHTISWNAESENLVVSRYIDSLAPGSSLSECLTDLLSVVDLVQDELDRVLESFRDRSVTVEDGNSPTGPELHRFA